MAIAYKSQGSGVATETSGAALSPLCPATVDANDILIAHVYWEGTTDAPSTPSGWTMLGSSPYVIETTVSRHWVFGKIAAGTEDGASVAFGSPAVTTQRGARIYSFSGYTTGTIESVTGGFAHTSNATDPTAPTVGPTPAESGVLVVLLVGQNDNNTLANFTGESGGDYTEAVAEFTANLTPGLGMGIQTSTLTTIGGTISGGSDNTLNDPAGVIGFYIWDGDLPVSESTLPKLGEDVTQRVLLSTGDTIIGNPLENVALQAFVATEETLRVGLDDASLALSIQSVTDTASQLAEASTVDITDMSGGLTPITASDTMTGTPTESAAIFASVSTPDTFGGLTEDATSLLFARIEDTCSSLAEQTSGLITDQRTDTLPGLAEASSLSTQDMDGGITTVAASESLQVGIGEDFTALLLARADEAISSLADSPSLVVAVATEEALAGFSDAISARALSLDDSLAAHLTETATAQVLGGVQQVKTTTVTYDGGTTVTADSETVEADYVGGETMANVLVEA